MNASSYKQGICVLISVLACTSLQANENTHRQGINIEVLAVEYPPFTTLQHPSHGVAFELLDTALANSPMHITPYIVPPARAQKYVSEGNWCASFYPPRQGPTSNSFFALGETIDVSILNLTAHPPFDFDDDTNLDGQSVAVLRPAKEGELHDKLTQRGLDLVFVESVFQGMELLQKERVNFAMGDKYSLAQFNEEKESKLVVNYSKTPLVSTPIGIFVNEQCSIYPLLKQYLVD
ncbi:hypothetical protein [Pseudoalteromonas sp. GB56]